MRGELTTSAATAYNAYMLQSTRLVALMEARQFAASGAGRMIRQTARLSLAQVADALDVNASSVFRWETKQQIPSGDHAIAYHELMKRLSTAGTVRVKPRRKVPCVSERLTYTIEEAARLLGVSRGTANESARRGELPTLRLGRRLLVPRARLEELLGAGGVERNGDGQRAA